MKPTVTFNDIDIDIINNSSELDESDKFKLLVKAMGINSEGKKRCDYHKSLNITKTTDGEKPYVIVVCYLDRGVDDTDRNY